jgi:tetratricopeptide (TPR) repeat protein
MSYPNNIELEKKIDAYLKGQLSEEEVDKLWATLLQYPEYYKHLKTELALKRHFESNETNHDGTPITPITDIDTPENGTPSSTSTQEPGNQWKWTLAAAAVVIIILGLNFLLPDHNQTARQMAMANIDIKSMETPDVLRSSGGQPDSQVSSLISMGFNDALSGNEDQAETQFNSALEAMEAPANTMDSLSLASAHLNLGIIFYNHEQYDKASDSFEAALEYAEPSERIKEKAFWYLANTLLNQEKLEEAREAVHSTYAMNGIYREPSYRLLRKLDYELGYVDYDNYEQQSEELGQ